MTPMFRAEVIGSMLRPSYLKEGRAAFEQGALPVRELKRLEDRAVDQAIAMQEGAGVDVVSDGEMRRFLFMGPITETVEGIEPVEHDSAMPWSTPEGFAGADVEPAAARWDDELGLYVLDWDDVIAAPDPHDTALGFTRSVFRHACVVCDWDPALLASAEGSPPPVR